MLSQVVIECRVKFPLVKLLEFLGRAAGTKCVPGMCFTVLLCIIIIIIGICSHICKVASIHISLLYIINS